MHRAAAAYISVSSSKALAQTRKVLCVRAHCTPKSHKTVSTIHVVSGESGRFHLHRTVTAGMRRPPEEQDKTERKKRRRRSARCTTAPPGSNVILPLDFFFLITHGRYLFLTPQQEPSTFLTKKEKKIVRLLPSFFFCLSRGHFKISEGNSVSLPPMKVGGVLWSVLNYYRKQHRLRLAEIEQKKFFGMVKENGF